MPMNALATRHCRIWPRMRTPGPKWTAKIHLLTRRICRCSALECRGRSSFLPQYLAEISTILWRAYGLAGSTQARRPYRKGEYDHGHLQLRFATDASCAGGKLHRHGVAGADPRNAGARRGALVV